jgi:hypothetical protein
MRLFAVLTLVLVLPFTGLRLVCLDDADSGAGSRTPLASATRTADGAACAHSCALHAKRAPRPACRLVAGDEDLCAFMIDGVSAVLQRSLDLRIALTVSPLASVPTVVAYPAPMLAPPGPPPKV